MANKGYVLCNHSRVFMLGMICAVIAISESIAICSHLLHRYDCSNVKMYNNSEEVTYAILTCYGHPWTPYSNVTEIILDNAIFLNTYNYHKYDYTVVMYSWLISGCTLAAFSVSLMFSTYIMANCCVGLYYVLPWILCVIANALIDSFYLYSWYIKYSNHPSMEYMRQFVGDIDYTTLEKIQQRHKMELLPFTHVKLCMLTIRLITGVIYILSLCCVIVYFIQHFCLASDRKNLMPSLIRLEDKPIKSILKPTKTVIIHHRE